jgi:hypothetical protein
MIASLEASIDKRIGAMAVSTKEKVEAVETKVE